MRSRRTIKREPATCDQGDDSSAASELLVMQASHEELFRDDDSELLLSAANRFLCEDSGSSSALVFAPIDDFPSFQALLQAATSAVAAGEPDAASQSASATTARVSTRTQKRRERNRISCRKTRLKRKVEQASEDLLASKRAEHNRFLSELHHELVQAECDRQRSDSRKLEKEQKAVEFVVRSLHFQFMDPEYDASWCFESTATHTSLRDQGDANDMLLKQWRVIIAEMENASLEILQVHVQQDGSPSQYVICQWCLVGLSKQQLQNGRAERVVVSGETEVRFHGRSIESINMRVS